MISFVLKADENLAFLCGESMATNITGGQLNKYEEFENSAIISFYFAFNPNNGVSIYLNGKDLILAFDSIESREKYAGTFLPCIENKPPTKVLHTFLSFILKNELEKMQDLEQEITDTEVEVLNNGRRKYLSTITTYRKQLLVRKRYYEQFEQIFDGIAENGNGFFSEDDLRLFKILEKKTDRLLSHILTLRDYITQLREAYQAEMDLEQNVLMKMFTVITAIFLPLTLIVGWYGMNFKIPELHWNFGYLYVIILSAITVLALIWFFRKKKFF